MDENQPSTAPVVAPKGKKSLFMAVGLLVLGLVVLLMGRKSTMEINTVANTTTLTNASIPSSKPTDNTGTSTNAAVNTMPVVTLESTGAVSNYKDGTYTAVGSYTAPSGQETVGITLTLADGVITAVSVDKQAVNPTSVKFQTMFADGVSAVVVGKTLNDLLVGKVSGSSLTPKGFNDALAKIKTEAKA